MKNPQTTLLLMLTAGAGAEFCVIFPLVAGHVGLVVSSVNESRIWLVFYVVVNELEKCIFASTNGM